MNDLEEEVIIILSENIEAVDINTPITSVSVQHELNNMNHSKKNQ